MAQEMVTIEIEAELYKRLTQLAAQRGQTLGEVLQSAVGEVPSPPPYAPGQHPALQLAGTIDTDQPPTSPPPTQQDLETFPLLRVAGIIDTDQKDISETIRETMQDDDLYDEYGFTSKK